MINLIDFTVRDNSNMLVNSATFPWQLPLLLSELLGVWGLSLSCANNSNAKRMQKMCETNIYVHKPFSREKNDIENDSFPFFVDKQTVFVLRTSMLYHFNLFDARRHPCVKNHSPFQ